jgi:hypothetical protein
VSARDFADRYDTQCAEWDASHWRGRALAAEAELAELRAMLHLGTSAVAGAELIAAERERQAAVEGWTAAHDAHHTDGQLVRAAICYAKPPSHRGMLTYNVSAASTGISDRGDRFVHYPVGWPWHPNHWKPSPDDRIRELVKAGALIAAEIDRLIVASEESA